jgi:hypothetical protein
MLSRESIEDRTGFRSGVKNLQPETADLNTSIWVAHVSLETFQSAAGKFPDATARRFPGIKAGGIWIIMGPRPSRSLIEILRSSAEKVELNSDLLPDDPAVVEFERGIVRSIADLEVAGASAADEMNFQTGAEEIVPQVHAGMISSTEKYSPP